MVHIMQEADIRAGLDAGGHITAVYVVAERDDAGGPRHTPYLLPSWKRRYAPIGLFRGNGLRAFRDLDRLLRFVREELAYLGPVVLHEDDDPKLGTIRTGR